MRALTRLQPRVGWDLVCCVAIMRWQGDTQSASARCNDVRAVTAGTTFAVTTLSTDVAWVVYESHESLT